MRDDTQLSAGRPVSFNVLTSIMAASMLVVMSTSAAFAQSAGKPAPRTTPSSHVSDSTRRSDSAFAAVQARGADARGMGVDQYTSPHQFDALPDGGRIELQRAVDDSAGVAQIRRHMREISAAFTRGDFHTPAFVHMQQVPGTAIMAAKHAAITYTVRDLPRGAEVRITTRDPDALAAVHEFIAFQRSDHHAEGVGTSQHTRQMPTDHSHKPR